MKKYVLALGLMVGMISSSLVAAVPTEITTGITDATDLWGDVLSLKTAIIVGVIVLAIVAKLRR